MSFVSPDNKKLGKTQSFRLGSSSSRAHDRQKNFIFDISLKSINLEHKSGSLQPDGKYAVQILRGPQQSQIKRFDLKKWKTNAGSKQVYAANRSKVIDIDLDFRIQTVMHCIAYAEGTTLDQYQRKLVTVRILQEQSPDPATAGSMNEFSR